MLRRSRVVDLDWQHLYWRAENVGYPETLITEVPTDVAAELLTKLTGEHVSMGLAAWLDVLRGDIVHARGQARLPMFPGGVEG